MPLMLPRLTDPNPLPLLMMLQTATATVATLGQNGQSLMTRRVCIIRFPIHYQETVQVNIYVHAVQCVLEAE